MIAYAGAQCLSSDFTGALDTCAQAVELAVRIGRPDLAGEAALVPEPTFDEGIDRADPGAVRTRPGRPRRRAGRSFGRGCWPTTPGCATTSPTCDAANPAAAEALVLAEASGDPTALEAALTAHHMVRSGPTGSPSARSTRTGCGRSGPAPAGRPPACRHRSGASTPRASGATSARAARELEAIDRWATRVGGPMAQWRLLRCRAMLAQARGRYADAYRLGAQAFGTLAATGYPPAFLLWGGLLSIQCHHTGQTSEALGTVGHHRRGRDGAGLAADRCHPDPGTGEHAGRCRPAAGGRRRLPPARPGLRVAGVAARRCSSPGRCGMRDRHGGRRGRRRRDTARQARRLARAPRRQRPLRDGVRRARPSCISAGRPHTSGSSTMRSPTSSKR